MTKGLWASVSRRGDYFLIASSVLYGFILAHLLFRNTLLSVSVDLAHHTALAQALRQTLSTQRADIQPFLGGMDRYPGLSHRLAAMFINLGDDPVNALTVTGIGACVGTWLLLLGVTARGSLTALLLFATLSVVVIASVSPGALFGFEMVSNYFYAQAVGDCFSVAAVIVAVLLLTRQGSLACLWFCLIAVFIAAQIHLMAGLRLVLVADLAFALTAYWRYRAERTFDVAALSGLVLLPASLYVNPSYASMKKYAENDGGLAFGFPATPHSVFLLAAGVFMIALVGLFSEDFVRRPVGSPTPLTPAETGSRARTIIFLLAAACAIGAMVQVAVFTRHMGSEYAIKKHVFGTLTFGLAALCLLIGKGVDSLVKTPYSVNWPRIAILVLPLHLLIVLGVFLRPSAIDVPAFIRVTRDVEALKDVFSGEPRDRAPIFASTTLPSPLNYYQTVAILNSPMDNNAMTLLNNRKLEKFNAISHILTRTGDPVFDVKSCREQSSRPLVVVIEPHCYEAYLMETIVPVALNQTIPLNKAGPFIGTRGWLMPESWGSWTTEKSAFVKLRLNKPVTTDEINLVVQGHAFLGGTLTHQTVHVSINHHPVGTLEYDLQHNEDIHILSAPASIIGPDRMMEIEFITDKLTSPAEAGASIDSRKLGLGVEFLTVR